MAKGKVLARMTDAKVSDPPSRVLGVFVVLCDSWLPEFRQSARGAGPTGGLRFGIYGGTAPEVGMEAIV